MRSVRVALPVLLCLLLVAVAPAAASARTRVPSCGQYRYAPRLVTLACSDDAFGLERMRWSRWTTAAAFGRGLVFADDCDPYCAAGHLHVYRVHVALAGVLRCGGTRIFRRARIRYVGRRPPGRPRVQRWRFACV
jgi:hypothetical protein